MAELDDLLSGLSLRVDPLALCDVRQGRSLSMPPQDAAGVHYVLRGRGRIRFDDGSEIGFEPDTVVICPTGLGQRIEAEEGEWLGPTRCVEPAIGLQWLHAGDEGPQVLFACGLVRAPLGAMATPFDALPAPLAELIPPSGGMRRAFQGMLDELAEPQLGSRAMAESLMKQWLILLLRHLAGKEDTRLPWLRAARDSRLAPAVAAMLAHPERNLDVSDLAALAGMSRSSFVARFGEIFGQPPHAFLTDCRLQEAARLLRETDLPVKAVASRVGYNSRSHFSRTFKDRFGCDPTLWRQETGDL